jgi:crotonobetainyl-CoA:carnitine CoA-transferase CaiB-like acyl-CoA transferase
VQQGPSDPNAGMHAAFALLAALIERDRTGAGMEVEVPMVEGALAVAAEAIVEWSAYGARLERNGNRSPNVAPQGLYPSPGDDVWLAISIATDEQWRALAKVVGRPEWCSDPELATVAGRVRRQDELDEHLGRWAAAIPVDDAVEVLIGAGIPAAPARDPRLLLDHPQLRDRGYHEEIAHPEVGVRATPSMPFRSQHVDRWLRRPAPTLGEHNHEILVGELGLSEAEYEGLCAQRVIGTTPTM